MLREPWVGGELLSTGLRSRIHDFTTHQTATKRYQVLSRTIHMFWECYYLQDRKPMRWRCISVKIMSHCACSFTNYNVSNRSENMQPKQHIITISTFLFNFAIAINQWLKPQPWAIWKSPSSRPVAVVMTTWLPAASLHKLMFRGRRWGSIRLHKEYIDQFWNVKETCFNPRLPRIICVNPLQIIEPGWAFLINKIEVSI